MHFAETCEKKFLVYLKKRVKVVQQIKKLRSFY